MRLAVLCRDPLLREGIQSLLVNEGGFPVSGTVEQASSLKRIISEDDDNVVVAVADNLESSDWVQLGELKNTGKAKVVLSVSSSTSAIGQRSGDAVVRRSEGADALIQTVRRFVGSQPGKFDPATVRETSGTYGAPRMLTKRELEVAQLVAQGMPNRRIAQTLNLQEQSIKNLVSGIMRKLDCENRVQVALRLTGKGYSGRARS